MNALTALLAAGILAQSPSTPDGTTGADGLAAGDARIEAGVVTWDLGTGRYVLEGGAIVRRGAVALRAARATYDPATGAVDASGGVLLTDPRRAVAADAVHAILGGEVEATDVVAFVKDEAVALGDAESVEVARRLGRNRLTFRGSRLVAAPDGRLRVNGARLTLCDCGLDRAPSWLVEAREADVIPGDRAILRGAVVHVTPRFLGIDRPVPVLPVPWLYVPLGDRQSGVLLPEYRSSNALGPSLALPVYFTMGRSADLTVTPTWSFGGSIGGDAPIRGPGVELELRWAPWIGTQGRLELRWVEDREGASGPDGAGDGGTRLALTGEHVQRVSDRTRLRLDLALFDDPYQLDRFGTDLLLRQLDYTRSALLVEHRRDDAVIALDASYRLEMLPRLAFQPELLEDFGRFGSGLDTVHRWPSLQAELLPMRIAGPLRLSARGGASRWAPLDGPADGPRASTTRLDGRAELSAPMHAGDVLVVEPYVRGAGVARSISGPDDTASAWGAFGVTVSTELARRSGALRHAIVPRVEWRGGSGVLGDGPDVPALDAWDVGAAVADPERPYLLSALPGGAFQQLRLALGNRLTLGGATLLDLEVGQDVDLRGGRFAELWATGLVAAGPLSLRGTVRGLPFDGRPGGEPAHAFDSALDRFTELQLDARLGNRRGDFLHAGLVSVGPGASGTLVAGMEPLFDLRPAFGEPVAQGSAGVQFGVGGATIGYRALFPARERLVSSCRDGAPPVVIDPLEVEQHVGTFGWNSPCRCFNLLVALTVDRCGDVNVGATLDLNAIGARLFRPEG